MTEEPLWGKYKGVVTGNEDAEKRGLIQFKVDVLGDYSEHWAEPCVPYAADKVGLYAVPPVGAGVWIEFERGDLQYPIWSGCFWPQGQEAPVEEGNADTKVLETARGRIVISDASDAPGISIITKDGNGNDKMKIVINDDGIEINNGQGASIKLENGKVSINGNALEVE